MYGSRYQASSEPLGEALRNACGHPRDTCPPDRIHAARAVFARSMALSARIQSPLRPKYCVKLPLHTAQSRYGAGASPRKRTRWKAAHSRPASHLGREAPKGRFEGASATAHAGGARACGSDSRSTSQALAPRGAQADPWRVGASGRPAVGARSPGGCTLACPRTVVLAGRGSQRGIVAHARTTHSEHYRLPLRKMLSRKGLAVVIREAHKVLPECTHEAVSIPVGAVHEGRNVGVSPEASDIIGLWHLLCTVSLIRGRPGESWHKP